jgi:hypothetical protein
MKSAFWRSIAVVALVAVPMMANANDATIGSEVSHAAMQGGTLMNTTAIFNAFPHLVVLNGNGVELAADEDGNGNGKFWYEAYDGTWLNFTVGRNDLGLQGTNFMWGGNGFMPYAPLAGLLSDSPFSEAMWVNLGFARPTSGGGAWAANIQFAMGADTFEDTAAGDEFTNDTNGFGAQLSWGNGNGLHLSGEFAMQGAESEDPTADPTITDDVSLMDFGVSARYDTDNYIYQGNFVYLSASDDVDEEDFSAFGVMVSAGRYVRNEVDGQATVEFGFDWLNGTSDDKAASTEDKFNMFAIPTMRVAAWQQISDRFGLMGGVDWSYAMASTEDTGDEEKFSASGSDFDWSVGLYFQPNDRVRIDAQLAEDNLDHMLSLGNQEELITYIGATVGLN